MDETNERLTQLAELWRRAHELENEAVARSRADRPLPDRVREGLAVDRLVVTDIHGAAGGRYKLQLQRDGSPIDFHPGPSSPVVLSRSRAGTTERYDGVLKSGTDGTFSVITNTLPDAPDEGRFVLEPTASRTTWERGRDALRRLRAQPVDRTLHALLRDRVPIETERRLLDDAEGAAAAEDNLNTLQREAVLRATEAEHTFLLHGPPGTGKSHALVAIVRRLLARGERVLLTAPSNAAVDHLVHRLLDRGVDVLRLGHPARVDPLLAGATLDERLTRLEDWALAQSWIREARRLESQRARASSSGRPGPQDRALRREIDRLWKDVRTTLRHAEDACMATAPVVATTCTGAGSRRLDGQHFDTVLIDEATQALDPLLFCALGRAPRRILAGDPHQLSPMVPPELERTPLAHPLFGRLLSTWGHAMTTRLAVQYRMHTTVMEHASRQHYDGSLEADASVASAMLEDLPGVQPDPDRPGPLLFLDTAGRGWDEERPAEGESWRNPGMAERTAGEVRRLLARGVRATDIGVITPYAAQRTLLREHLRSEAKAGLEIDTVDAFQGREKEVIVWDTVRSGQQELGFLRDVRRLNVAWTRARRLLFIVGDSATLGLLPWWDEALSWIESSGHWRSVWQDEP